MRKVAIISAVRTPVGKCRGTLAPMPSYKLGAITIKEAAKRANVDPATIDEVVYANLTSAEVVNMGRMALLEAGFPLEVPAITVNRNCASSLNAIAIGAMMIEGGHADTILAGGVETESRSSFVMEKPSQAYQMNPPKFLPPTFAPPSLGDPPMIISAENIAERWGITREEADEYSLESHRRAAKAWEEGLFDSQIIPVEFMDKKTPVKFEKDECFRANADLAAMAKLRPVMKADGIVTAGNSSQMSDASSAVVLMELEKAKAEGHEILATFEDFVSIGVDPNVMGIGPVYATRKLMAKLNMTIDDFDLIELNEAFASQTLACIKELGIDKDKLNVNGGAIALGHPLAATGGILTTKMIYELKRRNLDTGLITFCCGGGQGVAALIRNYKG